MKIEILFSDICNQYGDKGNIIYLQKLIDIAKKTDEEGEHEIYFTELNDDIRFIKEQIDFVYIGSLSETKINVVLEKLYNHRLEILKKIENGQMILATR
ncbi:MAG: hypothetical protein HG454_005320 [Clostridiales bacterium]|jgi:hypothetical protein|nr:hypothetical protein [Clostridiales bacterium]